MNTIEFWFDFASTYSYLSAHRVERLCLDNGINLFWKPFLLGPIFKAQAWNNSPFVLYPSKGTYMWRDMERQAETYSLDFKRPDTFPRNSLLAARVAIAGQKEPWLPAFVRAVYREEFVFNADISTHQVIADILNSLPADYAIEAKHWLELAQMQRIKDALRAQTEQAMKRGIFGAPTFVVGSELFWGNDRLEEALAWTKRQGPKL